MITSALLYIIYIFILGITSPFRLLPDVFLPNSIISAITATNGFIASIYAIIPNTIISILVALGLFISIEGFILLWKIINWSIKKIPGIS